MNEVKSWLSSSYSGCNYNDGEDQDLAKARRRKAIAELQGLIREKHIQQIDRMLKGM